MIIIGVPQRFKEQMYIAWNRWQVLMASTEEQLKSVGVLENKITDLKREISTLIIEKSQKAEEYARKEREIEHKIGLVKKSQELELESQKLTLREENLKNKEQAFTEKMNYITTRMETENKYVREMLEQMMAKLPTAEIMMSIKNGGKKDG